MKNKKRILIVSGSILVIVITAIVLCILAMQKDPNPAVSSDLDPDAVVRTEPSAEKTAEKQEEKPEEKSEEKPDGIRILGYPRITIQADTKDVTMNLKNPEGNPCYFTFEIVLTDEDETLYISEMVEPGKAITNVTLSRALEKGEYPAMIKIKTTSLADGLEMNGANVETILVVQ